MAMMMSSNPIIKQPLVTLNTSVHDVPSQSLESFGEHGDVSGQLLLSTGNDYDVVKEDMREENNVQIGQHENAQHQRELFHRLMFQGKLWADQVDDEVDFDDSDGKESEGGSPLSVGSPTAKGNKATQTSPKKQLCPLAPVFVPSSKAMITAHDRALLDALESPTPHKFALSAGAQMLQSSGKNNNTNIQSQASIDKPNIKEGVVTRQPPMRVAKQKGATPITSTRPNRSKKK